MCIYINGLSIWALLSKQCWIWYWKPTMVYATLEMWTMQYKPKYLESPTHCVTHNITNVHTINCDG